MTKHLLAAFALSISSLGSLSAAELLLNGTFEGPALTTDGNHLGTKPDNWIVAAVATPTTQNDNLSNLSRGVVNSGSGVTDPSQYLGICPQDNVSGHTQSLDGNGVNVVVFQTFVPAVTLNTPVEIKISFGGRDVGSASGAGSSWQLINTATNAVLASASGFTVATGSWVASDVVTPVVTLTAGVTYKFLVNLDNAQHMDAASITTVPEPSVFALAGVALAAGTAVRLRAARRRRA